MGIIKVEALNDVKDPLIELLKHYESHQMQHNTWTYRLAMSSSLCTRHSLSGLISFGDEVAEEAARREALEAKGEILDHLRINGSYRAMERLAAKAKNALSGRVDKVKRVQDLVQQDYFVLTDLAVQEIEAGCVLFKCNSLACLPAFLPACWVRGFRCCSLMRGLRDPTARLSVEECAQGRRADPGIQGLLNESARGF